MINSVLTLSFSDKLVTKLAILADPPESNIRFTYSPPKVEWK
ncbi:hypothetical protein SMITH_405 [Smithella sp. ME-1]|nr:hypothetical protein SMITH_405 [Smithella sp. ME-1]